MTRYRISAQGTATFHEAWRNHTPTARREHVHGKLLPMERPEDEGSHIGGVLWLALILSILAFLWVIS